MIAFSLSVLSFFFVLCLFLAQASMHEPKDYRVPWQPTVILVTDLHTKKGKPTTNILKLVHHKSYSLWFRVTLYITYIYFKLFIKQFQQLNLKLKK